MIGTEQCTVLGLVIILLKIAKIVIPLIEFIPGIQVFAQYTFEFIRS
jgi:hypothetical protein